MARVARQKAREILDILEQADPDARIYLNFGSPLELLLATIMAAQCTDEKVTFTTCCLKRLDREGDPGGVSYQLGPRGGLVQGFDFQYSDRGVLF